MARKNADQGRAEKFIERLSGKTKSVPLGGLSAPDATKPKKPKLAPKPVNAKKPVPLGGLSAPRKKGRKVSE